MPTARPYCNSRMAGGRARPSPVRYPPYHAAALSQPDAVLVTADERYFGKAAALGRIVRLRDWPAWFAGR